MKPTAHTRRACGLALLAAAAIGGGAAAALLAAAGDGGESAATTPAARPNLVVVLTDDQRAGDLRAMPTVRRRIARRGVSFANHVSSFPLCCPSRATMLTGRYAHNHGVLANDPPHGGYPAFRRLPAGRTLAVRLHRSGYRTGYVGDLMNEYGVPRASEVPPGWDSWDGLIGDTTRTMYGYLLNHDGQVRRYGTSPRDYQTDVLARKARRFAARAGRGGRPFFLTFAPTAPHQEATTAIGPATGGLNPRPAPRDAGAFSRARLPKAPSFNERTVNDKPAVYRDPRLDAGERRALERLYRSRLASLRAVDDAVGAIVRALRRAGVLGETVLVFTTDNGFLLGEHRQIGKELPFRESAEVPMLVRGPGFPRGAKRFQPTANVDLAPTLLDLAGLSWRRSDGISLTRLADDAQARSDRAILVERSRYEGIPYAGIRTRRYVYVRYRRDHSSPQELYDLAADPFQLRNLAQSASHRDLRDRLRQGVRELRGCAGGECRRVRFSGGRQRLRGGPGAGHARK